MKKLVLAAAMLLTTGTFAQMTTKQIVEAKKWDFSICSDSTKCMNSILSYTDALKAKNYEAAYEPWTVVFNECPKANKSKLYIDGLQIAKALYKTTKDEKYYDLILKIYDQRMQYFGTDKSYPTSYLKGMKAIDMLTYKQGDEINKTAIELLSESLKGDPTTIDPAFTVKYMFTSVDLFKAKVYTAENIVDNYINAGNVITAIQNCDKKFAGKTDAEKAAKKEKFDASVNSAKENVDQIFAQSGAADVETLENVFGPQLEANKDNVDWLSKVNRFLSRSKGGDECELFFATSEYLHKIQPAASSARGLARMSVKKQDFEAAVTYYNQAIELESDNNDKAKYYYELALVQFTKHAFGASKSACLAAANLRSDWGAPIILLGRVYAAAAPSIGSEDWEKKAGYWCAVDKMYKAKSIDESCAAEAQQFINQFSQYFPKKDDLFMHGMLAGASYTVGGIINETTKVRSK